MNFLTHYFSWTLLFVGFGWLPGLNVWIWDGFNTTWIICLKDALIKILKSNFLSNPDDECHCSPVCENGDSQHVADCLLCFRWAVCSVTFIWRRSFFQLFMSWLQSEMFYSDIVKRKKELTCCCWIVVCVSCRFCSTICSSWVCFTGALADCRLQPGLFITAPQEMEALSGSCLIITCNFGVNISAKETFDSLTATFGVWIKNDSRFGNNPNNMIFNSSRMNNIYPMDITGDLSQKNCTTLFSSLITSYTDTYYFRFENWPFLATASCDPLQITVKGKTVCYLGVCICIVYVGLLQVVWLLSD